MLDNFLKALVLGVVEGVTEFLPISSTGHLIVAGALLGVQGSFAATFEIVIQVGAVLAVCWHYRRDLWAQLLAARTERSARWLWLNLLLAFAPAAVVGLLAHEWIKTRLFTPTIVAGSLILGGAAILAIERRPSIKQTDSLLSVTPRQAILIGLAQVLALIPGVSRAATSIMGGLVTGLNRETATAFSFYLALLTLGSASLFDLSSNFSRLAAGDLWLLAAGIAAAFVTSLLVIGWLLRYVASHDFRPFGYYRIVAGLVILVWSVTAN